MCVQQKSETYNSSPLFGTEACIGIRDGIVRMYMNGVHVFTFLRLEFLIADIVAATLFFHSGRHAGSLRSEQEEDDCGGEARGRDGMH